MTADLKRKISERARAEGFAAAHFTTARLPATAGERLDHFLDKGHQGDMAWMAETKDRRRSPDALWPDARTAIVLTTRYTPPADPLTLLDTPDRGVISVYAQSKDYHDVIKKRLKRLARWIVEEATRTEVGGAEVKVFVDTAPILEKTVAQQAGAGWQGKHTNLVSRQDGSWLFLGEILTTLDLPPDPPERDHCGSCRACLDICPTDAFPTPYTLDARKCVSYLTIEHKGVIPEDLKPKMGNRIYGCDDCLAVCPWNKFANAPADPALPKREDLWGPALADLARLDDTAFREKFRGSPIKRTGRDRFVRNVLIAIGNSGDKSLLPLAESLVEDPSDVVRDSAAYAVRCLKSRRFD
ncbi:MAG: tRNA epoxyqueuosine(34) reductase QueG [Alphaproteobacteria bacterium]|nr:tRNA epoxyqueuosine(34) reductase QueG [Alphaproteobacteria bacterium]